MINIISPSKFKTRPCKNDLAETIELAINEGGTSDNFDWQLSIESVIEDGLFSNFEGYTRNLVLTDGYGISLQHNDNKIDKLTNILDIATFDGGNKTVGNLHAGDITKFNVITCTKSINANVITHTKLVNHALENSDLCFIFSLYRDAELLIAGTEQVIKLPCGHLLQMNNILENNTSETLYVSGTHLIIVYLTRQ